MPAGGEKDFPFPVLPAMAEAVGRLPQSGRRSRSASGTAPSPSGCPAGTPLTVSARPAGAEVGGARAEGAWWGGAEGSPRGRRRRISDCL